MTPTALRDTGVPGQAGGGRPAHPSLGAPAALAALFVAALVLRPQIVGAAPLLPEIETDLAVPHAVAGLLGTIPVLCMGIFAPAAGALAARWGLGATMTTCVTAVGVFGVLRALAPDMPFLLLLTAPIGIATAVASTLLPIAVKARFAHRPAFASGVCTTGLNVGAATSSALATPIAAAAGGWRGALAAFSAVSVALAAGSVLLSRDADNRRLSQPGARMPFRQPVAWLIVAVFALNSVVYYGLVAWLPDAFQERGYSPSTAGALLAVIGAASLPAGLAVPWLADRAGSRRLWLTGASGTLVLATTGIATVPAAGFAWATLTGAAVGAIFPLCLAVCLDLARSPTEAGGNAALMFLAGYPLAALAPLGLGLARDLTGTFTTSLWILVIAALLLLASCAPLTPTRLRPRESGQPDSPGRAGHGH